MERDPLTMDKRTFLQFCTMAMSGPFLGSLVSWAQEEKLSNWAGNVVYGTDRIYSAHSVEKVQEFVRKTEKFKVLGTRHCFNRIADSETQFLSLRSLDKVVALDPGTHTVTIESGMSYGQLCPTLESKGFALHNLASLPHISVAGACSTATHGSGINNGNLATAVSGIEFVNAKGDMVRLTPEKDGDTFRGAIVGLGALGVVTRLTLKVQPTFQMQQYVYENLPMSELQTHFAAIESAAYSVSLFTDWRTPSINEVWLKHRMDDGKTFDAPKEFYGAKRATKNLHPIAEISAENCTEQLGVPGPWYERLPHFRMGFTPSAGKELQSEYFVPRANAVEAILAIAALREQVSPHLLITEIRTIAADDLWMSTAYKQDSVAIHFTWKPEWPEVSKLLPVIEHELAPFQARPHWGKLFTMPPDRLRSHYVKLAAFQELAWNHDPKGKFRNDFLNKNLFG